MNEKLEPYQIRLGKTLLAEIKKSAKKNQEQGKVNPEIRRMIRKVLELEEMHNRN